MSNNSQLNHLGEQMKGALNDALNTGNYDNLKNLVSDTVSSAIKEAGTTTSKAWQQKEEWKRQQAAQRGMNASEEWKRQQEIRKQQETALRAQQEAQLRERQVQNAQLRYQKTGLMVDIKNTGKVAGILFVVFGSIANVPLFILSIIGLAGGWGSAGVLLFFLLVSVFFICHGKSKIQLVEKAKRYAKLCGTKMYAEVEELAAQVGLSRKKVERELRKILQKGIIPTAHMDKKGTHLMLNEVIYKQYMDAENARLLRDKEAKEQAKLEAKNEKQIVITEIEPKTELEQMIEEGQECIEKLRYMNDLIPGEVISAKLDSLEKLLKEIFQRLEKEPAQMNRMHKVMNYYLPTTLKLVEAYHEFDIISSPGEEIISAKMEIEATLDTINEAFVELLNSLFQDKVYDVTTDAQVLQTMLANEGLTKEMDIMKVNNESPEGNL